MISFDYTVVGCIVAENNCDVYYCDDADKVFACRNVFVGRRFLTLYMEVSTIRMYFSNFTNLTLHYFRFRKFKCIESGLGQCSVWCNFIGKVLNAIMLSSCIIKLTNCLFLVCVIVKYFIGFYFATFSNIELMYRKQDS